MSSHSDRSALKKKLKEIKKIEEREKGRGRSEKRRKEDKEKDKESEDKEKSRMASTKDAGRGKTVRTESLL